MDGSRDARTATGPQPRLAAVGAAAHLADADVVLDLGSLHPSAHGALRLALAVDGDRVVAAEPLVGLLHRGAEKLFEVRDYRQVMMLANRHDWLSAFGSELGVALAAERMLGITVPERAAWARTLLAELSRTQAALLHLATACAEEAPGGDLPGLREREAVLSVLEEASGGRIHQMANRVGGLAHDLPAGWLDRVVSAAATVSAGLGALSDRLRSPAVVDRTGGVAVLSRDAAIAYAVSGPVARASGLDLDLRRDDPYLVYAELAADGVLRVPTATAGDAQARLGVLLDQVPVSLDIVTACCQRLRDVPDGPMDVRLPKVLRVPEGSTYAWTEGVSGVNGYYLVSTADRTPWRLKLRSASFNNVQALAAALPGTRVQQLAAALMSFFFVVGDVDK